MDHINIKNNKKLYVKISAISSPPLEQVFILVVFFIVALWRNELSKVRVRVL